MSIKKNAEKSEVFITFKRCMIFSVIKCFSIVNEGTYNRDKIPQ